MKEYIINITSGIFNMIAGAAIAIIIIGVINA